MTRLERRYRRLLAAYPKEHRARHADEMIAVLLAAAGPGTRRPPLGDAYDVLRGGLAIRLRRAGDPARRHHWRDAVNVAAVVAPLAIFAPLLVRAAVLGSRALPGGFAEPEAQELLEQVVYALPYGLVALLAWAGRRRAALAVAVAYAVVKAVDRLWRASQPFVVLVEDGVVLIKDRSAELDGVGLVLLPAVLCAALLVVASAPGAGPLGSSRLLGWTAVALGLPITAALVAWRWGLPVAFAVALTATVVALRAPAGRRAVLALTPMAAVIAGGVPGAGATVNTVLLATLSAAVLGVTAWLSRGAAVPSRAADPSP